MPIKSFRSDVHAAAASHDYPRLSKIQPGEFDGSVAFIFQDPELEAKIEFQAVVSDASDYPKAHSFVVFTSSDNVAAPVTKALEHAQDSGVFARASVGEVLFLIDRMVYNTLHATKESIEKSDQESEYVHSDSEDIEDFSDGETTFGLYKSVPRLAPLVLARLRQDLRLVKEAGFKVGYVGSQKSELILSIARRISKLGISEEAMQTWSVQSSEYLVLLIRYPHGYQNMQKIFEMGDQADTFVQMRVGLCDSYRPATFNDALLQFLPFRSPRLFPQPHTTKTTSSAPWPLKIRPEDEPAGSSNAPEPVSTEPEPVNNIRPVFIGAALHKLLNERLFRILSLRKEHGISWTSAELLFQFCQGRAPAPEDASDPQFHQEDTWLSPPTSLLTSDHYKEMQLDLSKTSFPLVVMQFFLRHFVRCTEFCLVCHCKTGDQVESLKPYVCSRELCLYQYMIYGLGPCLEHEIRTQPLVVDLLISLAYARAHAGLLEDFPTGLGIKVPSTLVSPSYLIARLNLSKMTMDFPELSASGIRLGDWIFIENDVNGSPILSHFRVIEIDRTKNRLSLTTPFKATSSKIDNVPDKTDVNFVRYDQNFDLLGPFEKQKMMMIILDTLPKVSEMVDFLGSSSSENSLALWRERITPAAHDMLRWIIASNRSCILQDHADPSHLIRGMNGYTQFLLVQGAPDKEERFLRAIEMQALIKNMKKPTLFAWHGSQVCNWHSILREGLNFKKITNGRACGDGVYLSSIFDISMGYSREALPHSNWPHSELCVARVLSLNEVVNSPSQFVCTKPHFVVKQLDWIQPRYLFVGHHTVLPQHTPAPKESIPYYEQDKNYLARGPSNVPITIPLSAFSSQRRRLFGIETPNSSNSRLMVPDAPGGQEVFSNPPQDDCVSVLTATTDLNLLISDDELEDEIFENAPVQSSRTRLEENEQLLVSPRTSVSKTDFVPDCLDRETLPLIALPRYASTPATRLLQKHFQAVLKTQEKEDLAELGWYMDPNVITSMYQWIVELHSFDPALPLAQELKSAHMQSVVLELRFPPQFPIDPPFIRVIRPRFLEFAFGGGGHVTAGGAMCMELLTSSGWSPAICIESVLLQVRMALSSTDPRPARLAIGGRQDYGVGEAVAAFKRACRAHGWQVPRDMDLMVLG
ncbi:hypothetical protein N7466_006128 [Penicillium verhagenii]|uniref:uncharacterized protein n=1 Tax=Penicillium verhagenii TaxID=1562060 RepID=UPI002544F63D|nr:uncharacterized protein N7466_006128 [Penicillium verhagenii]KAJ5930635.1 hypothetical protein N7466_006128 [Penicillium verhagenii]